jgi:succinoglycan biosynthesis protein ExoO
MDDVSRIPDISVIIATYNVENYIERSIRSALDQQGLLVEIIVVDDSSTDNTVDIAKNINDKRVKLHSLKMNSGPSHARNEAMNMANAPWIAILDGDDALAPGRLLHCVKKALSYQADIIIDNLEVWNEATNTHDTMYRTKDFGENEFLDLATFISGNSSFLGGNSLGYVKPIFSKTFLIKNHLRYDTEVKIGEDYLLLAKALACGARCLIDRKIGYYYTRRAGSISHRLTSSDVKRIRDGDKRFLSNFEIGQDALKAQRRRDFNLDEAYYFTQLIEALKSKRLCDAIGIVIKRPTSLIHLWSPIWARLKKLRKEFKIPA